MAYNDQTTDNQNTQRYTKYRTADQNQAGTQTTQPATTAVQYADATQTVQGDANSGTDTQNTANTADTSAATGDAKSFYGKTDQASINSYVQAMLKGTGRENDAQMWANYISSRGGGPNSYWDNLITKNVGGDAGNSGAYVSGTGVAGQGSIFNKSGGNARSNALEDLLMKRAGQNIIPSATDPIIKAQTDAYNAQEQQAARQGLSAAGERVGANSNMGAEARSAAEQVGQRTGAFEGQVMQRELDARRQEVQNALSGAQGMLTAEEQMQLQEELAQLSLAQGAYQFDTGRQDRLAGF